MADSLSIATQANRMHRTDTPGRGWRLAVAAGWILATLTACGGGSGAGGSAGVAGNAGGDTGSSATTAPPPSVQEQQCAAAGWQRSVIDVGARARVMLWKTPPVWTQGAIIILHGGGGSASNFCVANVPLIEPQVRFTQMALAQGFAVFVPDSTDRVVDPAGRLCGKVWDDAAFGRDSLDIPFLDQLLNSTLPGLRPAGSRPEIFLTGLSSGGYMTVRAAARLGSRIAGFAPIASGDPFGWQRDCSPLPSDRSNVFGYAFDLDTRRPIGEVGACNNPNDAAERPWDAGSARPPFGLLHHLNDGIHDASCVQRVRRQLLARGFPERAALTLTGGSRDASWHYWQDDYNAPLLNFFRSLQGG